MLSDITKKDIAKVVEHSLDLNAIASEVADPKAGAIATFSGTTRDHHGGKKVLRLEYEAYVPMAEKVMRQIIEEMRRRWQVRRNVCLQFEVLVTITLITVDSRCIVSQNRRSAHKGNKRGGGRILYSSKRCLRSVPVWYR